MRLVLAAAVAVLALAPAGSAARTDTLAGIAASLARRHHPFIRSASRRRGVTFARRLALLSPAVPFAAFSGVR